MDDHLNTSQHPQPYHLRSLHDPGREGRLTPPLTRTKKAARDTPGALELPGVWLQNNPFDKGILLNIII